MLQLLSKLIRASGDERRATHDDGRSRSAVCKLNESIDNHKIGWMDRSNRPTSLLSIDSVGDGYTPENELNSIINCRFRMTTAEVNK